MAIAHGDVRSILAKHGYSEVRTIGEGSFGRAILVQAKDGSKAVCKMVDISRASAKETKDATKEGMLLASLKYPYVVKYRENFTTCGWFCILMDYCRGGDLSQQIQQAKKSRTTFPEEQVLRWFTQAMLALKYIHERHILHRDLKPGNFFLSRNNSIKMGDFGIAKVLANTLACAKTQIGTPYYLSPEVCQEKPYDWSSDIWAMGCLLYELCALKVPFDAQNISGLVQKICRGPIPAVPPPYSPFVRELVGQMLSRSPGLRPCADDILKKPQIQTIVKELLSEAQEDDSRPQSAAPPAERAPSCGPEGRGERREARERQPTPDLASARDCHYRQGDAVEYFSSTHGDWLPAVVLKVDAVGSIVIDLKPNTWMNKESQEKKIRRRRRSDSKSRAPERPNSARCYQPANNNAANAQQRVPSAGRRRAAAGGGA